MKVLAVLVVVLILLVAVIAFLAFRGGGGPELAPEFAEIIKNNKGENEASDTDNIPTWQQEIPEGARLVEDSDPAPRFDVVVSRKDEGPQAKIEFQISEQHGYMVDGILLEFWYCERDEETGEWVEDAKRISFYVNKRLGFKETVIDSTTPLEAEFRHLDIDLAQTTSENWRARVAHSDREIMPAED